MSIIAFATMERNFVNRCITIERDRIDNRIINLAPFDGLKIAIEQIFYAFYLSYLYRGSVSDALYQRAIVFTDILPSKLSDVRQQMKNELYVDGLRIAHSMLNVLSNNFNSNLRDPVFVSFEDAIILRQILNTPLDHEYKSYELLPTVTEDFFDLCVAMGGGGYDRDRHPTGRKSNAAIYIPSIELSSGACWDTVKNTNVQTVNKIAYVLFSQTPVEEINYAELSSKYRNSLSLSNKLEEVLSACSFSQYTVDNVFGIFASFAIEHDKYLMTDYESLNVADLCFDLITGSRYTDITFKCDENSHHFQKHPNLFSRLIHFFLNMISEGKLQPPKDLGLIAELMNLCNVTGGTSEMVVNFLTKPVNQITGAEAMAFRDSELAKLIPDRIIAAMEAADEDDASDDSMSEDSDDTVDDADNSDDMDLGGDDTDTGDDTIDESEEEEDDEQPETEIKPKLDPTMMLLELAKPNESMTSFLFKETLARRIDNILNNPPEHISPTDLLMLSRWRYQWLFLVSPACLRDFISRISIRLSDQ